MENWEKIAPDAIGSADSGSSVSTTVGVGGSVTG